MMHSTPTPNRPMTSNSGATTATRSHHSSSTSSSSSHAKRSTTLARLEDADSWRVARAFERAAREEWGRPWANYKPRPGTENRRRILSGLPPKPHEHDKIAPLTREAIVTMTPLKKPLAFPSP